MTSQPAIVIGIRNLQFDSIKTHGNAEVDPSPKVTPSVPTLIGPPFTRHGTSIATIPAGKVLHEQTGVDGDDDAWAEPGQESKDLGCFVLIVQTGFLRQGASSAFPDGWYDTSGGVHDEDAVGQGDDDGGGNSHDGTDHEVEAGMGNCGQGAKSMEKCGIRGHDDGW